MPPFPQYTFKAWCSVKKTETTLPLLGHMNFHYPFNEFNYQLNYYLNT